MGIMRNLFNKNVLIMINKTGMLCVLTLHPCSLNVRPTFTGRSPALPAILTDCKVTKYFCNRKRNRGKKCQNHP